MTRLLLPPSGGSVSSFLLTSVFLLLVVVVNQPLLLAVLVARERRPGAEEPQVPPQEGESGQDAFYREGGREGGIKCQFRCVEIGCPGFFFFGLPAPPSAMLMTMSTAR